VTDPTITAAARALLADMVTSGGRCGSCERLDPVHRDDCKAEALREALGTQNTDDDRAKPLAYAKFRERFWGHVQLHVDEDDGAENLHIDGEYAVYRRTDGPTTDGDAWAKRIRSATTEILAPDVVANLSRRQSMEPRNIRDLCASHEALRELVGQHDPTGADHMAEMWEHAQRADTAEAERDAALAEIERLRAHQGTT
jgi:hypothetical protein